MVKLSTHNPRRTVGYCYPIAALSDDTVLPTDKYGLQYADAAVRAVLFEDALLESVIALNGRPTNLQLDDLFEDDVGIAIVSREVCNQAGMSPEDLFLQFPQYNIQPQEEWDWDHAPSLTPLSTMNINFSHLSSIALANRDEIQFALRAAQRQSNPMLRFLASYQVIEVHIRHLFGELVRESAANPELQTNPWSLKEAMVSHSGEKRRIGILLGRCVTGITANGAKQRLKVAIDALFTQMGESSPPAIETALYTVRNRIVHRQFALVGATAAQLSAVCEAQEQLCFVMLHEYNQPSPLT